MHRLRSTRSVRCRHATRNTQHIRMQQCAHGRSSVDVSLPSFQRTLRSTSDTLSDGPEAVSGALGTRSGLFALATDCDALEWGLPPTAGWGMGIDRICQARARFPFHSCFARLQLGCGSGLGVHLWDWAHPMPHLRRDWAHTCHICRWTGLTPSHMSHLHQD